MALPYGTTGSLCPSFLPDRLVGLSVKRACAITLSRTVTNRPERTFGSLRYAFGGDHPSQTTHHTLSPQKRGLEPDHSKGRISPTAPRLLAQPLLSLRPILHIEGPNPM